MKKNDKIKIGYMPLAHATYWKFFPQHKKGTLEFAEKLKKYLSQFGQVYETGKLIDCYEHSKEARLLFQANDVDVLVLATVTYSTPDDVLLDLKKFPRPVIIWNTQVSSSIAPDMDFDKWMLEHGVTGVPGLTNLLEREETPYFLISGHTSNESTENHFREVVAALSAAKRIWGARIGLFGHIYPGMIDFGYDPTLMYSKFGVSSVPILGSVVTSTFRKVDQKDVDELAKKVTKKYSFAHEFQGEEFTNSVRLALAMKNIVKEQKLDALTVYCQSMWQNDEIGVVSCLGNSLLLEEGIFCSCEGDVPTALSGMILEELSGKGVFTEIWTNDFDNDQFMMGHSGQMNLGLFGDDPKSVRLSRHPWWNGCRGRGVCLQLQMPAGEATLLSICSTKDAKWRMVVTVGQVTDRPAVPLGAPNFFVKMDKPITEFIEAWGKSGAAHHMAMAYGDWRPQLKALSRVLDIEYRYI